MKRDRLEKSKYWHGEVAFLRLKEFREAKFQNHFENIE